MVILKGLLSLLLYLVNLIVTATAVLFFAAVYFLIPLRSGRRMMQEHVLQKMPMIYAQTNAWIMMISTKNHWDVLGTGELDPNRWYVMMSNHRSWIDILVLKKVFVHHIPPLKFFMKKELLWQLPLAGLACYVLHYPFMSRHSHAEIRKNPKLKGKDLETTKKACQRLREFPVTLINFLEVTRFTEAKKERQQSPFLHLLKPHTGGIATTIQELHDILAGIVNVTIAYPGKTPSVWEFVCGRFDRVVVRYEVLPITSNLIGDYYNDREFRANMQQWLNEIWLQKDSFLQRTLSCKN